MLAIDPGLRKLGWAHFVDGELVWADTSLGLKTGRGPEAWRWIAAKVQSDVAAPESRLPFGTTIVVEEMELYGLRGQKGRQEDVGELLGVAGACSMLTPGGSVHGYKPKQWKKQVPKPIHNERVLARLTAAERTRIHGDHNAIDAVGLGLYHLGRYRA